MKCYNHPEIDAVAICKSCSKGLCKECLTELENGIACTSTCVDEVKLLNSLISRSKNSYNVASGAYIRNAYIYGAMGITFVVFGVVLEIMTSFLSIMGGIFIIGAVLSYNSASKYKKAQ